MIMWSAKGFDGSLPLSSAMSCPSDTLVPVLTRLMACFRFAGVRRLAAPSWSSLPQRPQFESSVIQRSNCSFVAPGAFAR